VKRSGSDPTGGPTEPQFKNKADYSRSPAGARHRKPNTSMCDVLIFASQKTSKRMAVVGATL
jgi:hypothetical protein